MLFAEVALTDLQAFGVVGVLGGVITFLHRSLMAAKDEQIKSLTGIATEAVENLEQAARNKLAAEGKPPYVPVAPVVAEHASPTTKRQQATADLQTLRARAVAAALNLGLPARKASNEKTNP
jgi:hypothetical protein